MSPVGSTSVDVVMSHYCSPKVLTDTLGQGDGLLASSCLEVSSGTFLMEKNRGDRSLTGLCTWTLGLQWLTQLEVSWNL